MNNIAVFMDIIFIRRFGLLLLEKHSYVSVKRIIGMLLLWKEMEQLLAIYQEKHHVCAHCFSEEAAVYTVLLQDDGDILPIYLKVPCKIMFTAESEEIKKLKILLKTNNA